MKNQEEEGFALYRSPESFTIELTGRALDNLHRVETALAGRLTLEDIFARTTVADLSVLDTEGGAASFLLSIRGLMSLLDAQAATGAA